MDRSSGSPDGPLGRRSRKKQLPSGALFAGLAHWRGGESLAGSLPCRKSAPSQVHDDPQKRSFAGVFFWLADSLFFLFVFLFWWVSLNLGPRFFGPLALLRRFFCLIVGRVSCLVDTLSAGHLSPPGKRSLVLRFGCSVSCSCWSLVLSKQLVHGLLGEP